MPTVEDLLRAAQQLSASERRRLVHALQDDSADEPTEEQRREALAKLIEMAGRFHSSFTDISADKYKHLRDVYADER